MIRASNYKGGGVAIRTWLAAGTLLMFFQGCGNGTNAEPGATELITTEPMATEVVIQVSGAYTGQFESTGSIFCTGDEYGGPEEGFELYAMKVPEQFNLRMPRETTPGTYAITPSNESPIKFYYTDPQRVKYDRIESATVRFATVPQAQGERLRGSIEANLRSRKDQKAEIQVELDLDAGYQSFDECD